MPVTKSRSVLRREADQRGLPAPTFEQCPSVSTGGGWPTVQCGLTKGHAGSHESHPYGEGGLLSWPDGANGTTSGASTK
jgi:hypothetical protein